MAGLATVGKSPPMSRRTDISPRGHGMARCKDGVLNGNTGLGKKKRNSSACIQSERCT